MTHLYLGDHLKIWTDRYGFRAEVKYDTGPIRPKKIVVTSNYKITDLWTDPNITEPLLRRFKVIEYKKTVTINDAFGMSNRNFINMFESEMAMREDTNQIEIEKDPNDLDRYNDTQELIDDGYQSLDLDMNVDRS